MVIDPKNLSPREAYNLLVSAVVPRPIAFITSLNEHKSVNAAPYSFFNAIASSPPLVMISAERKNGAMKHTAENILRSERICGKYRHRKIAPSDEHFIGRFPAGDFRDWKQSHTCSKQEHQYAANCRIAGEF